jgi:hypothetical protein
VRKPTAAIPATAPITPQHELENHRPQEPTERHSEVKRPDQAKQAPGRSEAGADPEVEAALAVDAVDLLFDAGGYKLHCPDFLSRGAAWLASSLR